MCNSIIVIKGDTPQSIKMSGQTLIGTLIFYTMGFLTRNFVGERYTHLGKFECTSIGGDVVHKTSK